MAPSENPRASEPARHTVAVTPNYSVDLPAATTAIYVGVSGNLKVAMLGGEILTFNNVTARVASRATCIWTSTTTSIIAVWR